MKHYANHLEGFGALPRDFCTKSIRPRTNLVWEGIFQLKFLGLLECKEERRQHAYADDRQKDRKKLF